MVVRFLLFIYPQRVGSFPFVKDWYRLSIRMMSPGPAGGIMLSKGTNVVNLTWVPTLSSIKSNAWPTSGSERNLGRKLSTIA